MMTELEQKPGRQREDRWPRALPILVAVVATLLAVRVLLAFLGYPPTAEEKPQETPETPEWVTQNLLPVNPYSRPGDALERVNGVVVHYVGNPSTTAEQNRNYFAGLAEQVKAPYTSASSHFIIGLEGEIVQCIPLDEIAYCTSKERNLDTIAIECCHPDDSGAFTQETYNSLVKLVGWLQESYDLKPDQVIRHYDVTGKECPRDFVRNPEKWDQFLEDLKKK